MQARHLSIVISAVFLASVALGQTSEPSTSLPTQEILGAGKAHFLARFEGTYRIMDSSVFQGTNGNIGLGTTKPDSTLRVFNLKNSINTVGVPQPYAIYATLQNSTINFSSAIRGDALGMSGGVSGVIGLTYSHDGYGVTGVSVNSDGGGYGVNGSLAATSGNGGGGGVIGTTQLTTGFTSGVRGEAYGTSGGSVAVYGEAFSPAGSAGLFINRAGGTILVGGSGSTGGSVFRVDGSGVVYANGGFQPGGADFAESMAVNGDPSKYAAGDLLVIDPNGKRRLALSQQPYSTLVAGIYSTKPGMLGSNRMVTDAVAKDEVPLAVVGIVPCKVSAENGPIEVGDLLVASSTPGHAMKGTDRSKMLGAVVGKALEPLREGEGVVQVLVTLQ